MTDDLIGVRGPKSSSARWQPVRDLLNEGARALASQDFGRAESLLHQALQETSDVDGEGLDLRARTLANLSAAREGQGDLTGSLDLAEQAIQACTAAQRLAGDRHGNVMVQATARSHRAQTLVLLGRDAEALAEIDRALECVGRCADPDPVGLFAVHNTRTGLLIGAERYDEAEAAAQHTLAVAQEHVPVMAGHAYCNLGAIAQATGDDASADGYLAAARDLLALSGDTALVVENQARSAFAQGRVAEAADLFAEAEQAHEAAGQVLRVAACRYGRAAIAFVSDDGAAAQELLSSAIAVLRDAGAASGLVECLLLLGDLASAEQRHDDAEHAYVSARELCGAAHERARIDVRRARAMLARGALPQALDLVLPAALASEAFRHRFAAPAVRERWAVAVAAPSMTLAFAVATALSESLLIAELIENACATVAFTPVSVREDPLAALARVADPQPLRSPFPTADLRTEEELPYAAAALRSGTAQAQPSLALPPRLQVIPGHPAVLDPWITAAEQRYGIPVRTAEQVPSW